MENEEEVESKEEVKSEEETENEEEVESREELESETVKGRLVIELLEFEVVAVPESEQHHTTMLVI